MADDETVAEIRSQLEAALEGAEYPVDDQMDLVPALPDGPGTRFEAGDVSFTAMEMAARLGGHQEFPYADVDSLVDDIVEGLRAEDIV
ncbi:MAG: MTH865 family protein [Halolamina sp.]